MMLNDAPGGGSENGMMTGHVAGHAANDGAFQASFGISHDGQSHDSCGENKRSGKLAHLQILEGGRHPKYTSAGKNCAARSRRVIHFMFQPFQDWAPCSVRLIASLDQLPQGVAQPF
jgi:hypothetical protein